MIQKISNILFDKDVLIEFFRSTPAWIALIVSISAPLINKKLEIEKNKANFLYSKRFDVFETHFTKLYELRNATINLVAILRFHVEHKNCIDVNDINISQDNLHKKWEDVKFSEAGLWLVADYSQLQLKEPLLNTVKSLFEKINSLSENGELKLNKKDIEDLLALTQNMQKTISQTLENYRKVFILN